MLEEEWQHHQVKKWNRIKKYELFQYDSDDYGSIGQNQDPEFLIIY